MRGGVPPRMGLIATVTVTNPLQRPHRSIAHRRILISLPPLQRCGMFRVSAVAHRKGDIASQAAQLRPLDRGMPKYLFETLRVQ